MAKKAKPKPKTKPSARRKSKAGRVSGKTANAAPDVSAPAGYYTIAELADFMGVTLQAFRNAYAPIIPKNAKKAKPGAGRAYWVNGRQFFDAAVRREMQKAGPTGGAENDATAAALAEYRWQQTRIAKLKAGALEGELIAVDDIREALAILSSKLRQAGKKIRQEFGDRPAGIIETALDESKIAIRRYFVETGERDTIPAKKKAKANAKG